MKKDFFEDMVEYYAFKSTCTDQKFGNTCSGGLFWFLIGLLLLKIILG